MRHTFRSLIYQVMFPIGYPVLFASPVKCHPAQPQHHQSEVSLTGDEAEHDCDDHNEEHGEVLALAVPGYNWL